MSLPRKSECQLVRWIIFLLFYCTTAINSFSLPTNLENTAPSLDSLLTLQQGESLDVDTGSMIWDAGRALANYFLHNEPSFLDGQNVLELGSGTGIVGLTAAKLGASRVVLTDKSDLMPLLEENIAQNNLSQKVRKAPLIWGDTGGGETILGGKDFDIVCGSDLLYAAESFEPLIETLQQVCVVGKTQVWLAYPTRFTEQLFFEQVYQSGFEDIEPCEEIEPAIYLSRLVRTR